MARETARNAAITPEGPLGLVPRQKAARKTNTFDDFAAAARTLIDGPYTSAKRIVAHGGSAGGVLMGAVPNWAGELFAGIVLEVPFVDALNTAHCTHA